MTAIIKGVFALGPLLFGLGFLAPLTAQIIERAGWVPPFEASPLAVGLALGGLWGLYAQIKGSWL